MGNRDRHVIKRSRHTRPAGPGLWQFARLQRAKPKSAFQRTSTGRRSRAHYPGTIPAGLKQWPTESHPSLLPCLTAWPPPAIRKANPAMKRPGHSSRPEFKGCLRNLLTRISTGRTQRVPRCRPPSQSTELSPVFSQVQTEFSPGKSSILRGHEKSVNQLAEVSLPLRFLSPCLTTNQSVPSISRSTSGAASW